MILIFHQSLLLPLFFCTHTRSVATPNKHLVSSPPPGAHMHSVHHTRTIAHAIQHHATHGPILDIQHIHLYLVYVRIRAKCTSEDIHPHTTCDATKCIHIQMLYNTTHTPIPNVQHNTNTYLECNIMNAYVTIP